MANQSSENIKRWIEQSNIDYITHFIKAWIAFNSWYNFSYQILKTDREIINNIKSTSNPVSKAINYYLESDNINNDFSMYLNSLHYALLNSQIDKEGQLLSFSSIIKERNNTNVIDNEKRNTIKYYLKREDANRYGEIEGIEIFLKDRNNQTFFNYSHDEYNWIHLSSKARDKGLSQSQIVNLKGFFDELKPLVTIDLIEENPTDSPRNYYDCNNLKLKRDHNANRPSYYVCSAVIEVIYQLRNLLFHGELIPNDSVQPVYKDAYMLLKLILEKIK